MTRLKLALVKLVIAAGAAIILVWQWGEAMHKNNFGNESFNQGAVGQALLGVVMAGIPAILFAVVAYLVLEWLLFHPGELEDFRARRRLKETYRAIDKEPREPDAASSRHDYAD